MLALNIPSASGDHLLACDGTRGLRTIRRRTSTKDIIDEIDCIADRGCTITIRIRIARRWTATKDEIDIENRIADCDRAIAIGVPTRAVAQLDNPESNERALRVVSGVTIRELKR